MATIDSQDRAIEHERDDQLNRIPFIDNLIKALVVEERDLTGKVIARHSAGVVVGLTGKWGSGKSSILNLLAERLARIDHVAVAIFNPWLFKGREELLTAFFNELRDALGRNSSEYVRSIVEALDRYQWAISGAAHIGAAALDLHGGSGAATVTTKQALKSLEKWKRGNQKPISPQNERKALEKKLDEKKIAVVILIDELDRVEDDDVRYIAQLIKAVGDIRGVSYLVAYDPMRVAEALGGSKDPYKRGAAYLEKIIQHPIPLRPLFMNDIDTLLKLALKNQDSSLSTSSGEAEEAVLNHIKTVITTPREIKRLVGTYGILEPMVRGEISEIDILAYCWLITKSESLREELSKHLERVVDDPSAEELATRYSSAASHKMTPREALGESAEEFDKLLRLLFPRFGGSNHVEAGNRISRRRNLVRLLYLGNPPGMTPRSEVERLWDTRDIDGLVEDLCAALKLGTLSSLIDRLDDLLPSLSPSGDEIFWPALARALLRESDWLTGPETNGALADDAATYLMRFGAKK